MGELEPPSIRINGNKVWINGKRTKKLCDGRHDSDCCRIIFTDYIYIIKLHYVHPDMSTNQNMMEVDFYYNVVNKTDRHYFLKPISYDDKFNYICFPYIDVSDKNISTNQWKILCKIEDKYGLYDIDRRSNYCKSGRSLLIYDYGL